MKVKQISAVVFLLILALVPVTMWAYGSFSELPSFDSSKVYSGEYFEKIASGEYAVKIESFFKEHFLFKDKLSNLAWNLRFYTGAKEIDGYFVTDTSIIKNVSAPNKKLVKNTGETLLNFARRGNLPSCIMLIPTASAIKQQKLPAFATPYNQKTFIESTYQSFGGELATVDAYPILFANQEKSLYYNTEDALTPLGGYYIYTELSQKLRITANPISRFTIEYAMHGYNGSLSVRFPYAAVKSDVLTLYHYRNDKISRSYKLTRTEDDTICYLNDIYDRSRLGSGTPLDVYFGGMGQMLDIKVLSASGKPTVNLTKLIIFADETAKSYVPFLAPQYDEIKIINVETITEEQISDIDLLYYDQVLFAFSTDTYMHCENLAVLSEL